MKRESQLRLDRAIKAIQGAERDMEAKDTESAATRSYYAMFYIAEALLYQKDLKFHKHSAVHSAYGKHFSKTKELDPKFHQWLLASFEQRIISDYELEPDVLETGVKVQISQAKEFLEAAKKYLSA